MLQCRPRKNRSRLLRVQSQHVLVGTTRSPEGSRVPIAEVQAAIDQLFAVGSLEIRPKTVGYRSAFIGAVLSSIPGVRGALRPARVWIDRDRAQAPTTPDWTIQPGDRIARSDVHARYGGNPERGISFSAQTPNVMIFSSAAKGEAHGYLDHWEGDGLHYYGEGRFGDQDISQGNKSILFHRDRGRQLRVFEGTGGLVGFLGTFETDPEDPMYWTTGVDAEGSHRKMVVFRLVPLGLGWMKGALPLLHVGPETHEDLQSELADIIAGAGCTPFFVESDEPLFELGWVTPSGRYVIAEARDFQADEDDVLSQGLGHLILAKTELALSDVRVEPVLFVPKRPANSGWLDACEAVGIVIAWPGATQGLPTS